MDDLTFVVTRLKAEGKEQWGAVAEATGIPLNTLIKVARGYTKHPRYQTLRPLVEHYRRAG